MIIVIINKVILSFLLITMLCIAIESSWLSFTAVCGDVLQTSCSPHTSFSQLVSMFLSHLTPEFIKMADQYVPVPGGPNNNNYANVELIVDIAKRIPVQVGRMECPGLPKGNDALTSEQLNSAFQKGWGSLVLQDFDIQG